MRGDAPVVPRWANAHSAGFNVREKSQRLGERSVHPTGRKGECMANERSIWKGLFAGAFAGMAASVAMAVFQELVAQGTAGGSAGRAGGGSRGR